MSTATIRSEPALDDLFDRATVDRLLTTTRSVRRRLDLTRPVDPAVIEECIDLAVQAPCAHNQQSWRWMVVTDAATRGVLADLYRASFRIYRSSEGSARRRAPRAGAKQGSASPMDSAAWLAEHLHEVPVHVIACQLGRPPSSSQRASAVARTWQEAGRVADAGDGDPSADRVARAALSARRSSTARSSPRSGRSSSHCGVGAWAR